MNWSGKQHPVDTLVEWLAPVPLGTAVSWAAMQLGALPILAGALGVSLLAAGHALIRVAGRRLAVVGHDFKPAEFAPDAELGELLLEAKDELLILDDPLVQPGEDSRVVRLFADPQPTPGELVERIEDFLGDVPRTAAPEWAARSELQPIDASVALHAALANIRASLR